MVANMLMRGADQAGPQSIGRVFAVLDHLVAHRDGATLTELAAVAQAPKTSLVGLLKAMVVQGYISREHGARYLLGSRFLELALRAGAGRKLVDVAHPFLERLMSATGETAVLGTLSAQADLAVYVDRVESPNPIRYAVTVGERRELYCTALGKVLLAWMPRGGLETYLASHRLQRFTDTTITTAAGLQKELRHIRAEGLARTLGERFREANGVAAPIFLADGTVGAALLVAGPAQRMHAHRVVNEAAVRRLAAEVTDALRGLALQI